MDQFGCGMETFLLEMFSRQYPTMLRRACQLLKRRSDAEDAVQNACLRAWRSRSQLRQREKAVAWLNRILANECLAILRQRRRQQTLLSRENMERLTARLHQQTPEERWLLESRLSSLPDKYRIPFLLHYIEGFSIKQISARLRLPENRLRNRIAYAKRLLREKM